LAGDKDSTQQLGLSVCGVSSWKNEVSIARTLTRGGSEHVRAAVGASKSKTDANINNKAHHRLHSFHLPTSSNTIPTPRPNFYFYLVHFIIPVSSHRQYINHEILILCHGGGGSHWRLAGGIILYSIVALPSPYHRTLCHANGRE